MNYLDKAGSKKIFVSAGEPSGDAMLGAVLERLRRRLPDMEVHGLGGPAAAEFGLKSLFPLERTAVNGIWDVLCNARFLLGMYGRLSAALRSFQPDLVLLVDYPGLNLRLARTARAQGIPVHFIAPPQTWVYRRASRRKAKAGRYLMGCSVQVLFPFEAKDCSPYAEKVTVGHFFSKPKDPGRIIPRTRPKILALFPGSRAPIIMRNLPIWLERLDAMFPADAGQDTEEWAIQTEEREIHILVPGHLEASVTSWLRQSRSGKKGDKVRVRTDKAGLFAEAAWALAFPGTISLELALHRIPTLVLAVLDPLTLALGRRVLASDRLGLANLLLHENVFAEWHGTAANLTASRFAGLMAGLRAWKGDWGRIASDLDKVMGPNQGPEIAAGESLRLLGMN